jgi:hypothetical protein
MDAPSKAIVGNCDEFNTFGKGYVLHVGWKGRSTLFTKKLKSI